MNIDYVYYNSILEPIQHRRLDAPEHSPDTYSPEQDNLSSWQVPSLARQAESAPVRTKNQFYVNDKIIASKSSPLQLLYYLLLREAMYLNVRIKVSKIISTGRKPANDHSNKR